jgi:hypothetical protein
VEPLMTRGNLASWRELTDQLSPKQVEWLTEFESLNRPTDELLHAARSLASTRDEWLAITAGITAALEGSGLQGDNRAHHLQTAEMTLSVIGGLGACRPPSSWRSTHCLPPHGRFLRRARRVGRNGRPR